MPGHVRFVVDTNLFQEFKLLDSTDIDWSQVGDFDTVELVVCDVVQSELDRQKKDTRSRVKKRAIKAVGWFRAMLQAGVSEHVFREGDPRVIMTLEPTAPSRDHPEVLDPGVDDDRIVGVLAALRKADPGADIRLLTDDTRPAGKAKTLGAPFVFIPEEWRREPELDDQARENQSLRSQLETLKTAQPQIGVSADGAFNHRLTVEREAWAALTPAERPRLRDRIAARFPLVEVERRFALDAVRQRPGAWQFGIGDITTVPVAPEALARYRDETYPAWLNACVVEVEKLPGQLNAATPSIPIVVRLTNTGSRPGEDVRIRFRARGGFRIAPDGVEERPELPSLPRTPAPPRETYLSAEGNPIGTAASIRPISPTFAGLPRLNPIGAAREEELWYYEPSKPSEPVAQYDLVCRRFRHGGDEETFEVLILPEAQQDLVSAALEVEINASNLPEPVVQVFPLDIQTDFAASWPAVDAFLEGEDPIARALKSD